jgi:hypothetical protein
MYPETIRIILSGYTGLEAVLDSINRGAIYRFYTKPWDDTQLRDNIRLAFHHYWLMHGSGKLAGHAARCDRAAAASGSEVIEAGQLQVQRRPCASTSRKPLRRRCADARDRRGHAGRRARMACAMRPAP